MATRTARVVKIPRAKSVAVREHPTNILSIIAHAAADPAVMPDKMRALLDMQKEIMAEEARMAFTADYIKMSGELPVIDATGRIEIREKVGGERTGRIMQATPYATYNVIWKTVKPILQEHHFALLHSNEASADGRVIVRSTLMHDKGHQRESVIPLPLETSGSKNNVQGYGSSTSYGKRYNTVQLLNLISEAPEERDTDGVEVIDQKQLEELIALADEVGADKRRFCESMNIPSMKDLPVARLAEANALLKLKAARAKLKENTDAK